jgi:hypothetical protein
VIPLTEDIILLPNSLDHVLEIWKVSESPELTSSKPLCSLALPPLADHWTIGYMSCRGEPNPVSLENSGLMSSRPFHSRAETAIMLFNFIMTSPWSQSRIILVTHRHSILNLIPESPREVEDAPKILWEDWGPEFSRIIPLSVNSRVRITSSSGQRLVTCTPDDDWLGSTTTIWDFNPWSVRKDPSSSVTMGVSVGEDAGFRDDTTTRLPYHSKVLDKVKNIMTVMMDEERILGTEVSILNSLTARNSDNFCHSV